MRHAVSMTGCIDRKHERHRAIQLVKVRGWGEGDHGLSSGRTR